MRWREKPLPIYGDGQQIRDWLYVKRSLCGDSACAGGRRSRAPPTMSVAGNEKANLDIVHTVCGLLDELRPRPDGRPYCQQITYCR
jgi:dTDP-glucose 4,6-dehydratase